MLCQYVLPFCAGWKGGHIRSKQDAGRRALPGERCTRGLKEALKGGHECARGGVGAGERGGEGCTAEVRQ